MEIGSHSPDEVSPAKIRSDRRRNCVGYRLPGAKQTGLLLDHANRLTVKLKPKLDCDDDAVLAVWEGFIEDLNEEAGGYQLVRGLEMTGSHVFRVSSRQIIEAENLAQVLNDLYHQNVE